MDRECVDNLVLDQSLCSRIWPSDKREGNDAGRRHDLERRID